MLRDRQFRQLLDASQRQQLAARRMAGGSLDGRSQQAAPQPQRPRGEQYRPKETAIYVNEQTGTSYTLDLLDIGRIVQMNNASPNVVTVPTHAAAPFPLGTVLEVQQIGAGMTSVLGDTGVTVRSPGGLLNIAEQWGFVAVRKTDTDEWNVEGRLGSDVVEDVIVINGQTGDYTLVLADASKLIKVDSGSANVVTVPASASVSFPVGTAIEVMQYGVGQTTIAPDTGVTIRSPGGLLDIGDRYGLVALTKLATDEWSLEGRLA